MQFREMRGEDRLRLGKENKSFVLWFSARLALLCRCTAKIGCGSEKKTKTSFFVLLFARLALLCGCTAKIGCVSEKKTKTSFFVLLFARLALSLQIVCGH